MHRPNLGRESTARAWGHWELSPGCGNGTRPRGPDLRTQAAYPRPPECRSFPPKRSSPPAARAPADQLPWKGRGREQGALRFRDGLARTRMGTARGARKQPRPPRGVQSPPGPTPAARGHAVWQRTRRGCEDPRGPDPHLSSKALSWRRQPTGAASHRVIIFY